MPMPVAPPDTTRPDAGSGSAFAAAAAQLRRAPDWALVASALVGLGGLALLGLLDRAWAPWLAPAIALGAAGGWGIADREHRERAARGRSTAAFGALRVACAVVAGLALVLFAGRVLGLLFGTVIS